MLLALLAIASLFALGALIWRLIKKFINHLFHDDDDESTLDDYSSTDNIF